MFFSIIVPVYNVEKYLPICLKSLANQTYTNYEVILVDDGSSDQSGKICDDWVKINSRFRVIHKKNQGLLLARRTGLEAAKGDYILHCDSDDYVSEYLLQVVYEKISETHSDMVLYGYNVVNDNDMVLEKHFQLSTHTKEIKKKYIIEKLIETTWLNNMVTKATRRDCYDFDFDYYPFNTLKMGEDLFQVIPLVERCRTFSLINKPLYYYRRNENGMSRKYSLSYLDDYYLVATRLKKLCYDECPEILTTFYNTYIHGLVRYLIIFQTINLPYNEYLMAYEHVNKDPLFAEARKTHVHIKISSLILYAFERPSISIFTRRVVRLIFKKHFLR